jgi:hypothetical protein
VADAATRNDRRMGVRGFGVAAAVIGTVLALAGCHSAAKTNHPVNLSSLPLFSPAAPEPTATVSIPLPSTPATSTAETSPSVSIHPAPATPERTATVDNNGRHYVIKIWFEVHNVDCAEHAYGQVAAFLSAHPCRGLTRQLATTTVKGKAVGFAVSSLSIPGSSQQNPYDNAAAFHTLVDADGTGSLNDLLREGYRLPSGPTSVPSPDAFRSLIQDTGINVYDMWYLDGPTPDNDPALEQMAQDIYLAY